MLFYKYFNHRQHGMSCKPSPCILGKMEYHLTLVLAIHGYVSIRIIFGEVLFNDPFIQIHKSYQTVTFYGCICSFWNVSDWSSLQNRQFCLLTYPLSFLSKWNNKMDIISMMYNKIQRFASVHAFYIFTPISESNLNYVLHFVQFN